MGLPLERDIEHTTDTVSNTKQISKPLIGSIMQNLLKLKNSQPII